MRLIFMGTPDFAVPTLLALAAAGHEIAAVYTRAAKPAGRGMELQPSPVEREARRLGLPVLTPKTLKDDAAQAAFRAHKAEAAVVVAYGLILPKPILEAPRLGCFNVHASLLPRWRGAAPINRAVMAGDPEGGVSIMKMDEGLDTGKVAKKKSVVIDTDMTAGDLHDLLARIGAERMPLRALDALDRGSIRYKRQPEDETVTYAYKISKDETRIDWTQAVATGTQPHPRPVAVSRRLVRGRGHAGQGAALDQGRGRRCARHAARRSADRRLRRRRGAAHAGAARR